ncbi:flagellar hook-basal body protein FliE [Escherichia coli]|uniref:flagellar hook-basal body complex protein FliE n=1 Tax=Escherichia coli TaxID=562 RepID=UPI0010ABF630|nr:flagellar hook-basal body complex protein FliE [Escherichia coli]TIY94117.1 flagellar hook-basal body protein FliE [Escherichia coli]
MSITTINSTMQAQIMQDVQRMQANAPEPVRPAMNFSYNNTDVSFHRIMQGALGHVDQFQQVAEQQQTAIDMGKSDDLAGAMIASQQASLSFSALVQVRNKIATGFNDLMSMSI